MPLNMMQQQQQQPQMQHPPMDAYGGQGGYTHQEQPQPDYSAYYQQQQPPAAYEGNPYGYDTNQNPYGAAPGYGQQQQHQPSAYASGYQQQQPDYGASRPMSQQMSAPLVNGGLDDGWVLFDNDSDLNAPIANPFGTPAFGDDLPWASSGYGAEDPLAVFNTTDSADAAAIREEEERKAARKAKRKEDRRKKKEQESEDEKLARRLQEEEDARAAAAASRSAPSSNPRASTGGSVLTSSRVNSGAVSTNRVALTHVEVRELAEEEIGKDNIRILAGFSVTKFGREGRPHQRKMWINSALTHLAWESSQYDGSHRGLELKQVVGIRIGEMTPTIRRSTKDARKVRSLCFSLETQARTLDLQACSVIQRDALAAALKKAVEFNQRHKPRRVDKYRTELFI